MDSVQALSVTCKHLNTDCSDITYSKLKRQKHAAHVMSYRLRKNTALELTNKLLTICWISVTQENKIIREYISQYVKQIRELHDT